MRKTRRKQLQKAQKLEGLSIKRKWIEEIKEENEGVFEHPLCSGCDEPLDLEDEYSYKYGFCSVDCGMRTFGLSYSDFY